MTVVREPAPAVESPQFGLTSLEAAEALRRFGPNLVAAERRMPMALAWAVRVLTDPMAMLLVVASVTYVALGDRADAIVASVALVPVIIVGVVLEGRADAALARLREMTAPRARVLREGGEHEVASSEVVPGDVLALAEGDVVAADGELIGGRLALDESALTGESMPVERSPHDEPAISSGTIVVGGRGQARVTATGASTRYGAIATLLGTIKTPRTPIENAIRGLVVRLSVAVVIVCAAVILIERSRGSPWGVGLIAGVSLAMAAVPEELPMVYTLYLALGAWRLSRDKALVRRLGSVETLGSISTICVDKTGTLTYGRVELAEIVACGDATRELVLETALLASEREGSDPLDIALTRAAATDPRPSATLLADEPYEAHRRYASKSWDLAGVNVRAVKGALESVALLVAPAETLANDIRAAGEALAQRGMRVLAIARADAAGPLRLIGFAAFRDPIRDDAPAALAACRAASVRVVMITGDHPATASAIARLCGFGEDADRIVTGEQLESTPESAIPRLVDGARVFARTHPEQKLKIVRALRASGQVVAMTGDGTNDALALRQADIGIAMGERGTEVAREAAGLILLDDDISTIVRAVRNGRRIFENLRRALAYLVGFHAPLLLPAILLPILGMPLLLAPIHFVWLELIVHPTSSLVFESDEAPADVMQRPPRRVADGIFRPQDWFRVVALGTALAAVVILVDAYALANGLGEDAARAAAFIAMFVGQTALIFVERSPHRPIWKGTRPTRTAFALSTLSISSLTVAIAFPPAAALLHLTPPPWQLAVVAAVMGALSVLWWEPLKR